MLYELVYDGPFDGSVEDRRAHLWMLILSKYEDQGVPASRRMGDLDLGRFRHSNDFAELRAKAAEARHLLPVVAAVCADVPAWADRDCHRLAALQHLSSIYDVFAQSGDVLNVGEYAAVIRHADLFCYITIGSGILDCMKGGWCTR